MLALQLKKYFGWLMLVIGLLNAFGFVAAAVVLLCEQTIDWLTTGSWPPRPISMLSGDVGIPLYSDLHVAVLLGLLAMLFLCLAGFGATVKDQAEAAIKLEYRLLKKPKKKGPGPKLASFAGRLMGRRDSARVRGHLISND